MADFHTLKIQDIQRVTEAAVAITFEVPSALKDIFSFDAGQYITLKTDINGSEVRRAYSLCSSPASGALTVAVKEVENGTFSVHANRNLKVGDALEVHPPEGKFTLPVSAFANLPNDEAGAQSTTFAAFAAGSGITPVLSMIKTVLTQSEVHSFVLVYGNKTPKDTMFREEILSLREQFKNRFSVEFIYSQAREDGAHFGRILRATVNFVIKNKYSAHTFDSFYLCGPEAMIKEVSKVLQENGQDKENIHFELFTASTDNTAPAVAIGDGQSAVHIIVDDETFDINMSQDSSILDAALDADIDAPYSCQGGICSSCIARITEGTAVMQKNQILTDSEVAEGLVLTCQAHPTSAKVVVNYDEV